MKKLLAILLCLAIVFTFAACGGSSEEPAPADDQQEEATEPAEEGGEEAATTVEPLTIKMYNAVAGKTIDGTLIPTTIDLLTKYSDGAITVELIPAGTLGAEKEAVQLLTLGDIDMLPLSIDGVDWGTPDVQMQWTSLPYLFNSFDEVDSEYNNGWMFQRHKEVAAKYGICLLENIENGFKCLIGTGKTPTSMDDLKGKIVRCPDIELFHYYYKQLGMTTISGIDQYTGLQQGTMDIITNSPWAMNVFSLHEVADWILLTQDTWGTMYWTCGQAWFDGLTPAQQEVVQKAASEAAIDCRQVMRNDQTEFLEKAKEAGVEVVELTPEMKEAFIAAANKTWDELGPTYDPEPMERLNKEYRPEL